MYIKALEIDSPVTAPSFWTERFTNTNIFFSSDMQLLKNYMSAAAFRQQFFSSIPIYARQTFGFLLGCRITVNPINYFSNTCSNGKNAQRQKLPWTYCLSWFLHDSYDGCMTMACERFSKDGQNFNCPPAQDTTHSKGRNTFLHLLRQTVSNLP